MVSPFREGMLVEASSDLRGSGGGAWFVGKILKSPSTSHRRSSRTMSYLVEYQTLLSKKNPDKLLVENVASHFLRPQPPSHSEEGFQVGEVVDAYCNDGWWIGIIRNVFDEEEDIPKSYNVVFQNLSDFRKFTADSLRSHLDWVDGKWIKPPIKKQRIKVVGSGSSSKRKKVELFYPKLEDEKLNDFVERAAEEDTHKDPKSPVFRNLLALCDSAEKIKEHTLPTFKINWVTPPVKKPRTKLVRDGNPKRKREDDSSSTLKEGKLDKTEDAGRQIVEEDTTGDPAFSVLKNPADDKFVENEHVLIAVAAENTPTDTALVVFMNASDEKLDETEDVVRAVVEEITPGELVCVGNQSENVEGQTDSSLQTKDICVVAGECDTIPDINEPIFPLELTADPNMDSETVKGTTESKEKHDIGLQCDLTTPMIDLNEPPVVNDLIPCQHQSLQVCELNSSLLSIIQSVEVFQMMPQNPHFRPLDDCNEMLREGLIIGQWVTFSKVAEKITKLDMDSFNYTTFNNILECLLHLESSGFDVEAMQTRVLELHAMKDEQEERQMVYEKLKCEIDKLKEKLTEVNTKLYDSVQELEDDEDRVNAGEEERRLMTIKMEEGNSKISELKSFQRLLEKEILQVEEIFKTVAASIW